MHTHTLFFGLFLTFFATAPALAGGKSCSFQLKPADTVLEFTAFKFTEKAGVKGTFSKIKYKSDPERTLEEAAESIEAKIDTTSVETQDKGRNANIVAGFFVHTKSPYQIEAEVDSMNKGKAKVEIEFNGVETLIPMTYTVDQKQNTVEFVGESNMDKFNLGPAFKKLKELCKGLHTGKDGKSVMWPDFKLRLLAKFEKVCG